MKTKNPKINNNFQSGQAMLIVVLILGATMLGVTTIVGYVSLQKIKNVANITDSTKAIYAADSGVEWCFYNKIGSNGTSTFDCSGSSPTTGTSSLSLSNGSSVSVSESGQEVKSIGTDNSSYRAFGIFLDQFK